MELKRGYRQSEVGVIPSDWTVKSLNDISSQITDGDHLTPQREKNGYFLLSARNVRDGYIDLSDVDFVGPEEFKRMRQRCAPSSGDILISCSGHGLGRVSIVPKDLKCVLVRSAALVKIDGKHADSFFIHFWLRSTHAQKQIAMHLSRAAQPNLFLNNIERLLAPIPPTKTEQTAIAEALSDVDALIGSLDRHIAKKRDLKQAAMQQLLTGQKRLPGFESTNSHLKQTEVGKIPDDWEVERIRPLAAITTGSRNTQDRVEDGAYPFFVRSSTVERINSYSYDGEAVLTAGDGVGTGKVFHYINGKFDIHQRVYKISDFSPRLVGRFFFLVFSTRFYDRIMSMTAKSSDMIANMLIPLPSPAEQTAIAEVLSDMDTEIAAMEQKREKTRLLKQGMMQELLTGRTRLI